MVAAIYPTPIGPTPSPGERVLYDALSQQLDDEFVIFHRASWLAKADGSEPQDGEVDFALAHPELGLLILEVKGGLIRHDGASNLWYSRDRGGHEHPIKDPFEQVRREVYGLKSVAEATPDWPGWDVRFVRAVALPDIEYRTALVPSGPPDIVIDSDDMSRLAERVHEIFRYWSFSGSSAADGGGLGQRGMEVVTDLLARSFTLKTPLALDLATDEAEVIRLTEEQFRLLDFLRNHRQALITGVAGAGKTELAAEHARRLARQGMDVLLMCVDEPLAVRMQRDLGDVARLTVSTYGQVATDVIQATGGTVVRPLHEKWPGLAGSNQLFNVLREHGGRYDAVVVDEAQDIESIWWLSIHELLRDTQNGILYVFGDDNQDLYHTDPAEIGIKMVAVLPRFEIRESCRMTKSIHAFSERFAHPVVGVVKTLAGGPRGRPVDVLTYPAVTEADARPNSAPAHAMRSLVRTSLHRLVSREHVPPAEIVVLTPLEPERSWVAGNAVTPFLGSFHLIDDLTGGGCTQGRACEQQHVTAATVQRFKGLESSVVVLAEIDSRTSWEALLPLLYVGCTRARTHLIVLSDEPTSLRLGGMQASRARHSLQSLPAEEDASSP